MPGVFELPEDHWFLPFHVHAMQLQAWLGGGGLGFENAGGCSDRSSGGRFSAG